MFLKNLVKIRKEKCITQRKLANLSGVSHNTVIKIETDGIKNPKIETVIKLANALEVSLDELVGRNFKPSRK